MCNYENAVHYWANMSEVADCTAATSHSSRATQTRGGCIGSAVLRFCSVCVSQSIDRESGVGASVASHNSLCRISIPQPAELRRHEISDVQTLDCYDCYEQNPNKCIVQEDVHKISYGVYSVVAVYVYMYM